MKKYLFLSVIFFQVLSTNYTFGNNKQYEVFLNEAEKEISFSQVILAEHFYLNKKSNKYNLKKAIKYLNKAAKNNHPNAYKILGDLYSEGYGVEKNIKKAVNYYHRASKLGAGTANEKLVEIYQYGIGTNKNLAKAYAYALSHCSEGRKRKIDEIKKYLSIEDQEKAKIKAISILKNVNTAQEYCKKQIIEE